MDANLDSTEENICVLCHDVLEAGVFGLLKNTKIFEKVDLQWTWELEHVQLSQWSCAFCRLLLQTLELSEAFKSLKRGIVLCKLDESGFITHKIREESTLTGEANHG